MAKGYDKGRSPRGRVGDMGYPSSDDAVLAKKLGEIVSDLYLATSENDIRRLWSSAHRLLLKSKADPQRIEAVMKQRRIGALSTLATELHSATRPSVRSATAQAAPAESIIGAAAAQQGLVPPPPGAAEPPQSLIAGATTVEPPTRSTPSRDQLKSAMKAFRKRLKLTRLDDESRLGNRAMSGGRKSNIVAIMAPREYPPAVWQELAKQGKLKDAGGGFYELIGK